MCKLQLLILLLTTGCANGPVRKIDFPPSVNLYTDSVLVCVLQPSLKKLTCMLPEEAAIALSPVK